MMPNMYAKDSYGSSFPNLHQYGVPLSAIARMTYPSELEQSRTQSDSPKFKDGTQNPNTDSIMLVQKRKMLRRAANRRSAQLSRARKKAHLEELKIENARLQRLVDILDSQPEIVFCINAAGGVTNMTEKCVKFTKTHLSISNASDVTTLSDLLTTKSVGNVLESIKRLKQSTEGSVRGISTAHSAFFVKDIQFVGSFGHTMIGQLRCSKVNRKTSMQENQTSELLDEQSLGMSEAPSTKRSRKQAPNRDGEREDDESYGGKGWNLANFKLLTDCVSSLTEDGSFTIIKDIENNERNNYPGSTNSSIEWTVENGENGNSDDNSVSVSNEASHTSGEASITTAADDEYVCVVRTTPNYFGNSSFHKDILLFSSTADSPVRNSSPNATDNTDGSAQSGAVKIAVSETGSDNSCDSDL